MWVAMDEYKYFKKTLELFYQAIKQGLLTVKCVETGEKQLVLGMDFKFAASNSKPMNNNLNKNSI